MKAYDILILGGGVIGLCCARAILRRHPSLRIGIIDAPTRAMPASLAAAGMLAPYAEFSEETPLSRICEQSLHMYDGFIGELRDETGASVTFIQNGTLVPEMEEGERFEARRRNCENRKIDHRIIEGRELRKVEPNLSHQIERALWLPEALVNNRELHAALQQFASGHGAEWLVGRAIECETDGKKLIGIKTDDGSSVRCEKLLCATGAWTGGVAELLDLHFDIQPVKGQMTCIDAPEGFLKHVIHLKSLYLAPRPKAGIILGSTMEHAGFDSTVNEEVIAEFITNANMIAPRITDFSIVESWAGLRPRAIDGLPILGWTPRWENVLIATGHFRNGILLTPWTGEAVADLFDEPVSPKYEKFSPERFWT